MGLCLILFLCFVAWIGGHLLDRLLTKVQANLAELLGKSPYFGKEERRRKTEPSNVIILPVPASKPSRLDGTGKVRLNSYARAGVLRKSGKKKLSRKPGKGNLTGDPDVQGVR